MRKKMKIKIRHPGIEKARARKSGRSTHAQLEADAHSGNPTLERRGNLGLMFERAAARRRGRHKGHAKAAAIAHAADKKKKAY